MYNAWTKNKTVFTNYVTHFLDILAKRDIVRKKTTLANNIAKITKLVRINVKYFIAKTARKSILVMKKYINILLYEKLLNSDQRGSIHGRRRKLVARRVPCQL